MFLIFGNLRLSMTTTNLFVIANVKQLRTGGRFRILLPFFRTSWCVGVRNSAIFNSFHRRVEFGTILKGLRNFGEGVETPPVHHWRKEQLGQCPNLMGCQTEFDPVKPFSSIFLKDQEEHSMQDDWFWI